ncbi:hypothetical protein JCM10207_003898 [Rhodosporidiobolus poonsookiae]
MPSPAHYTTTSSSDRNAALAAIAATSTAAAEQGIRLGVSGLDGTCLWQLYIWESDEVQQLVEWHSITGEAAPMTLHLLEPAQPSRAKRDHVHTELRRNDESQEVRWNAWTRDGPASHLAMVLPAHDAGLPVELAVVPDYILFLLEALTTEYHHASAIPRFVSRVVELVVFFLLQEKPRAELPNSQHNAYDRSQIGDLAAFFVAHRRRDATLAARLEGILTLRTAETVTAVLMARPAVALTSEAHNELRAKRLGQVCATFTWIRRLLALEVPDNLRRHRPTHRPIALKAGSSPPSLPLQLRHAITGHSLAHGGTRRRSRSRGASAYEPRARWERWGGL